VAGCVIGRHEANKRAQTRTHQTGETDRELRNGEERF
jgi:hypothetical protein